MKLRTEIEATKANFQVNLSDKILTIGSCFSDVMGQKLLDNKINCLVNPFGTVFNPHSIFKLLSFCVQQKSLSESLFLQNADDIWLHHDFHSQFWATTKEELHQNINQQITSVANFLESSNLLVITFGTAFVYQPKNTAHFVSNCHKVPSSNFEKQLLSIKDICRDFAGLYKDLKAKNPSLKILLTVSPVRHTKDTLPLNAVSKAILRGACHYLENDFEDVHYFPSYEIMIDDLRDYRFYKADLIHPNEVAEAYIFEQFSKTYFSDNLLQFVEKWQKIKQGLAHRPQQVGTKSHQKFQVDLLNKLKQLADEVDVSVEISAINSTPRINAPVEFFSESL